MQRLLKRPGYRLYPPDSPEAGALLAEQGLGPRRPRAGLSPASNEPRALRSATIVGINEDGVFVVTRVGWRPDLPDALQEPFFPLLWLKVHELLGRMSEGSTARFVKDGTLPSEAQGGGATVYRLAS